MYGELVPVLVQQLLLSALVTRHAHGPAPALALLACSAALLALLLATRPTSLLWGLNLPVAVTALISKVRHLYNIHNLTSFTMCVQLGQIRSIHRNKDAGVVSFSASLLASVGELSSERREIFFIYAENIFETRKYFSGACVRNFTLVVLYTETAAERRDPVGLSICSLMSVCGLVLTYQVDTETLLCR